jgi:hypothetical protein
MQLERFAQSTAAKHAEMALQQSEYAHWLQSESLALTSQPEVVPPASSSGPGPPPELVLGSEQPASIVGTQSPSAGGRAVEEHAIAATTTQPRR